MSTLTSSAAWQALEKEYSIIANTHMKDMFAQDPARFDKFNAKGAGLHLDFSKNRITEETFALLIKLAQDRGVKKAADSMFKGEFVNTTEYRPALHIALRNRSNTPIMVDGQDVMPEVNATLAQMKAFTNKVHNGEWTGYTGKKIANIVNIGIGGSFLGPKVTIAGLQPYWINGIKTHFISNVDGSDAVETCKLLDPETTLFIIASKSFKTQETLFNSIAARNWFLETGATEADVAKHFVAVSTNIPAVTEFGINAENAFAMWDWVGGRYSLWSAIGLPVALQIGWDNFEELLSGAHEMDEHFKTAPLEKNLPVIMGVLSVWYSNFFNAQTHVVLPYDHYLRALPAHLQQLDMESNGKSLTQDGESLDYATGPIIWGGAGTNGQHSFHQLIHQGTHTIPADFFFPLETHNPVGEHHALLYSN